MVKAAYSCGKPAMGVGAGNVPAYLNKSCNVNQAVNDIVHPAVARDFLQSDYQWLESAILFDSGFHRRVPFSRVVCVSAPEAVRVSRIVARDAITEEKAREWIRRQMPQQQVEQLSDFVILNDGLHPLAPQLDKLLADLKPHPSPPQ